MKRFSKNVLRVLNEQTGEYETSPSVGSEDSADINFSNEGSNLTATNVHDALVELDTMISSLPPSTGGTGGDGTLSTLSVWDNSWTSVKTALMGFYSISTSQVANIIDLPETIDDKIYLIKTNSGNNNFYQLSNSNKKVVYVGFEYGTADVVWEKMIVQSELDGLTTNVTKNANDISTLNSQLNDRTYVTDLFAETDVGANSKRQVRYNKNTLNTPYTAGITTITSGLAIISTGSATYAGILCIPDGGASIYYVDKTQGTWGEWDKAVLNSTLQDTVATLNTNIESIETKIAKAIYSDDLLKMISDVNFVRWDENTLNTPFKDGLTSYKTGFAFTHCSQDTYKTIMAIPRGSLSIYIKSISNGTVYDWRKVSKNGDGELFLNGTAAKVLANNNAIQFETRIADGDTNNRRFVFLYNQNQTSNIAHVLRLSEITDGTQTTYTLYGQHNHDLMKETFALKDDLANAVYVTDLLAVTGQAKFVRWGTTTTNTPNSDGLTTFSTGMALCSCINDTYKVIVAWARGSNAMWIRSINNGTDRGWVAYATIDDLAKYLPLSGGTLSGALSIYNGHGRLASSSYVTQLESRNAIGETNNRRLLILTNSNSTSKPELEKAVQVSDITDGTQTTYTLYGQHNHDLMTETFATIEALAGYLPLSNGTLNGVNLFFNGGLGRVYTGGNVFQIESRQTVGDTTNRRYMSLGNATVRPSVGAAVVLTDVSSGTTKSYTMYGTNNITAGTTDYTAGTTALTSGFQYQVYE